MFTANLFSLRTCPSDRILSHPQVVENETRFERQTAHHGGDGLAGFLERPENADGKAAEAGDVLRAEAGSNSAAVLIVVPVDHVMNTFNSPMAAVDAQHLRG